uniref:Helicase ATP-binding domain-containing protein n=1 Tax=viral metagenome TaxID=1070528 RepID=A0A6C0JE54_9ZZZZ
MSTDLLAKLRIKKQPKRQDEVAIVLKPPQRYEEIVLKAQVIDKRKDKKINRELFMATIANKTIVVKKDIPEREIFQKSQEDTQVPPKEIVVIKKPKKLKKKLKLVDNIKTKRKARKRKSPIGVLREVAENLVVVGSVPISQRIAKKEANVLIKASSYYMNNRAIFVNFINSLFSPYKKELDEASKSATCNYDTASGFTLMGHQKIVRDYINLYTPYRGILLYHGLGSGKTCSSIAIAEGMKDDKRVIVMTPASLRRNYYEELKKCGDTMYRKNQFWEFISMTTQNVKTLSSVLNLSVEYIRREGGAWLVNMSKPSNYEDLGNDQKRSIDKQLDEMIRYKYQFISYNGLQRRHLNELMKGPNGKRNPFDNTVVIIDEAHNLVSRIVNKLGKNKESVSLDLYELLMSAKNARIILLSGTPIINYPNEIGILFNILRGYIKTWHFKLNISGGRRVTKETFKNMFRSTLLGGNVTDFIDYNATTTTLTLTRNPFGFVNKTSNKKYDGMRVGNRGNMTDEVFISHITKLLTKSRMTIQKTDVDMYKALPDTLDTFKDMFVDSENNVRNMGLFKRRILGLVSYYRSAQESLMPRYSKGANFHIVREEMSDFQFGVYEEARVQERKVEQNNAKKKAKKGKGGDIYEDTVSTYRIFSRAFCNFVFPRPQIKRPFPDKEGDMSDEVLLETADEDLLDAGVKLDNVDGRLDADEVIGSAIENAQSYDERIKTALKMLSDRKDEFLLPDVLETYSPKFLAMLDNIKNPDHRGLHLVYSQFRTLEGIGIFKIVLEANGFAEFKIKQRGGNWILDIAEKDMGKPCFVLYTGTESPEQKEIVRNIFNGDWKYIPPSLESSIRSMSDNNMYGEIIKVFMITASGAEGISLKNTRYVHIMEPYWHPVRMQQVIGRARRICSHQNLPEQLRTVDVFLYLMTFSEEQLSSDTTIELRLKDTSKLDKSIPITSDEALYEISNLKEEVTEKLLLAVKEAAIDCSLHSKAGSGEQLQCFTFGSVDPNNFSYNGSYADSDTDAVQQQNIQEKEIKNAVDVTIDGIKYAYDPTSNAVYDYDSFIRKQPVQIGSLIKTDSGYELKFL